MTNKFPSIAVLVLLAAALAGALALMNTPTATQEDRIPKQVVRTPERAHHADDVSPSSLTLGEGAYAAPAGRTLRFAYDATYESRLTAQTGAGEGIHIALRGEMTAAVVARRDKELLVEISFPRSRAKIRVGDSEPPSEDLERSLAETTVVRMTQDGRTLGYRFPASMTPDARNTVRTLVSGQRFVISSEVEAQWKCEESDSTGVFEAEYESGSRTGRERVIEKRKLAYRTGPADCTVGGTSVGVHDAGAGWMRSVKVDETLRISDSFAEMTITYATRARYTLEGWDDASTLPFRDLAWDAPESPVSGENDAVTAPGIEQDVSKVEVQDLLSALTLSMGAEGSAGSQEVQQMHATLARVVATRPDVLPLLRAFVSDLGTPTGTANVVVSAVATADTPAAQTFLTGVAAAQDLREHVRLAAITSAISLAKPGAEFVAALRGLADDDAVAETLRSSSLLMLGLCAGRGGQDESPESRMKSLLAREAKAQEQGRVETWLLAIGNSGAQEVLEPAARYLRSEDPNLRAAAAKALRHVKGGEVTQLLVDTASQEADPTTRGRAIEILAGRPDRLALGTVQKILSADPSPQVRIAAVRGLSRQRRQNPEALRLIQDTAASDKCEDVRKAAQAILRDG